MTAWRLLDEEGPRDGAWNMALDEALWQRTEEGAEKRVTVRLFAWQPRCLSIGYHQALKETCDVEFCRISGTDVVRRLTGGKAVLHDDEVTYSVTAPFGAAPFARLDLAGTYDVIARALASGLSALGLTVELQERRTLAPPSGSDPCFLVPSHKEVLSGGRKVVGSAQRRGKKAFLQHGAVPLRVDYVALARVSGRPLEDAEVFRSSFAGVADLKPDVSPGDLRRALGEGFAGVFGAEGLREPLRLDELALAGHLKAVRYGAESWTEHGKETLRRAM